MGEKWICPKCGQENDDLFCIKCGSPKPEQSEIVEEVKDAAEAAAAETAEEITTQAEEALDKVAAPAEEAVKAVEASSEAAATTQAATGMPAPKKKSPLLKIIIAAAVVVAAVIAVLCIFVFGKGKKTYENKLGNYSIVVPAGYKMKECDNGILAESKNAVFFVDYLETDHKGALVYDWYDLVEFKDRLFGELNATMGIEDGKSTILDPDTYGDDGIYSYSIEAVMEDEQPVTGEVHIQNAKKFGVYLITYYMKDGLSEKKAEKIKEDFSEFLNSFVSNGAPDVPSYESAKLGELYLGEIKVRSELVDDIDVGGKMCLISDPDGKEEIMIEIIFANSILEIFSWEGITDGQIEEYTSEKISKGRYDYDSYRATYRDKKNNLRAYGIYGIFADTSHPGVIAIEYDVSADKKDWAEEVVSDLMWSWHIYQ